MIIVGLTGLTGSGKSSFAGVLRKFGAHVIDADVIAHEVLELPSIKEGVCLLLKEKPFAPNGSLDRRAIARRVFSDHLLKQQFESLVLPEIVSRIKSKISELRGRSGVVVLDAPLLFQTGLDQVCDLVIVVKADREVRKRRLMSEHGYSEEEAELRIEGQRISIPEERADIIIENNYEYQRLEELAKKIWQALQDGSWTLAFRKRTGRRQL